MSHKFDDWTIGGNKNLLSEDPPSNYTPPPATGTTYAQVRYCHPTDQFIPLEQEYTGKLSFFNALAVAHSGAEERWSYYQIQIVDFLNDVKRDPAHPRHRLYAALNDFASLDHHGVPDPDMTLEERLYYIKNPMHPAIYQVVADWFNIELFVINSKLSIPHDKPAKTPRQDQHRDVTIRGSPNCRQVFLLRTGNSSYEALEPHPPPPFQQGYFWRFTGHLPPIPNHQSDGNAQVAAFNNHPYNFIVCPHWTSTDPGGRAIPTMGNKKREAAPPIIPRPTLPRTSRITKASIVTMVKDKRSWMAANPGQ